MRMWLSLTISLFLLGLAVQPAVAFRPETFINVSVPVFETRDQTGAVTTTVIPDLAYKLSTPSATPITWLLGYESLDSSTTSAFFKYLTADKNQEIGLRLEVGPQLSQAALSLSRPDFNSSANSLLIGYNQKERIQLLDAALDKFFAVFGFYPKTVGADYLDSYSLSYLASHYSVETAIFTNTDRKVKYADAYHPGISQNYDQPPYYPAQTNALYPAQSQSDKLNLVLVSLNPHLPGSQLEPTGMDERQLSGYLYYFGQKDLNEFSHLAIGADNRHDPLVGLNFFRQLFAVLAQTQEKLTLSTKTAHQFGDWFIARYPLTSPAYSYRTGGTQLAYFNPFYQLKLISREGVTQVDSIVWYQQGEAEPYWYQPLLDSQLILSIYNLSRQQILPLDLNRANFQVEYWDLAINTSQGRLRLEPKQIISSWPLEWTDAKFVDSSLVSDEYYYQAVNKRRWTQSPLVAVIVVGLLAWLIYQKSR